jgi:hypothetical protein
MGLKHLPPIIYDGLVFCVDAGNPKSYPGSGVTWFDIGGSGSSNGALTGGPTYSSSSGGIIVFDGTDDYVRTGFTYQNNSSYTMSCWIKTANTQNQRCGLMGFRNALFDNTSWSQTQLYITGDNDAGSSGNRLSFSSFNYNSTTQVYSSFRNIDETSSIVTTATWKNIIITSDSVSDILYIDSVLVGQNISSPSPTRTTVAPFIVGGAGNWSPGSPLSMLAGYYFNGSIALVSFYNRSLTSEEVLYNFNFSRTRFGV